MHKHHGTNLKLAPFHIVPPVCMSGNKSSFHSVVTALNYAKSKNRIYPKGIATSNLVVGD